MTTRAVSLSRTPDGSVLVASWTGLLNGDDGAPVGMPEYGDRSVQVTGTFGSGGSLRWEGSNDGTNYAVLTDPFGNALNFTAAGIRGVTEVVRWSRPRITAGDGTTALSVSVLLRRAGSAPRVISNQAMVGVS